MTEGFGHGKAVGPTGITTSTHQRPLGDQTPPIGTAPRALLTRPANRVALLLLVALLVFLIAIGIPAAPAKASTGIVRTVTNADGGIYWRSGIDWNTTVAQAGQGVYDGSQVELTCWQRGGTVPPYSNNPLWYQAQVVGGPGAGSGWVNDHFLMTSTNPPNLPESGVPACVDLASATVPSTPVSNVDLGQPQNDWHPWGPCQVRDFNGGPRGWVIASRTAAAGTHVVRNGMLFGWFDNGGAPGALGCPTSDEYDWNTGVRQDFEHGSLFWHSGMPHGVLTSANALQAINWAASNLNEPVYAGWCLQFVHDAYFSAGQDISSAYNPATYADARRSSLDLSLTPPPGALVFWWGTPGYEDGHVAISVGGGYAISTEERSTYDVHVLSIAERNASSKPYAGWLMP